MYIIQISDLHLKNDENDFKRKEEIFIEILDSIKKEISNKNDAILFCICGDIVDNCGDTFENINEKFKYAEKLFKYLMENFKEYSKCKIGICPGNHDYIKDAGFKLINQLAKYVKVEDYKEKSYKISFDDENVDFIFANSTYDGNYQKGHIDYDDLEKTLKSCRNSHRILINHHTIMSMDDKENNPSIINAANLIKIANKFDIQAVMHGHTHSVDGLTVGDNCVILGVGALFSENNSDVNSQFNLFQYRCGEFVEAFNCRYNKDLVEIGQEKISKLKIKIFDPYNKCFTDNSFSKIYDKLIDKLDATQSAICNVTLYGTFNYDEFKKDIEENFGTQKELRYSYSKLAEMWQAEKCPDELYFNHGQYFAVNGHKGIDEVIKQLKNKSTSSRAVLSTMNTIDFFVKDDEEYVPSFMSIQFGFEDKSCQKLYVSINLRALEASRFLKINICEILYLSEFLHEAFEFNKIEIVVNAFRVQKNENFNCFLKAELDSIPCTKVCKYVIKEKYKKICEMLEEKKDNQETVIVFSGMENLKNSFIESDEENHPKKYRDVINLIDKILIQLDNIAKFRSEHSITTQKQKIARNEIYNYYNELIEILHNMNDGSKLQ